jgi:ABC-type uncharacterized transport system ATPase subunit
MSEILLSAHDLTVRFGGVLAVNQVSFDVRQGEVFTLIGPNGAGKTTVFNLISRIHADIRLSAIQWPAFKRYAGASGRGHGHSAYLSKHRIV